MKGLLLLCLLTSSVYGQIVTGGGLPVTPITLRGLVAEYRMIDATGSILPDASGITGNGALVAIPTIGSTGITFNGTSQRADLPGILTANVTSTCVYYTPSMVNPGATGVYFPLVEASTNLGLNLFAKNGGAAGIVNNYPSLYMSNSSKTVSAISSPSGPTQVCLVLDASTDHLYINGAEVLRYSAQTGNIATTRQGTLALAGGTGYSLYAPVILHHAAFWSSALTAAEVLSTYTAVNGMLLTRGILPASTVNGTYNNTIYCKGDSITFGLGFTPPCSQFTGLIDTFATPYNFGLSGAALFGGTIPAMLDTVTAEYVTVYTPLAKRNVSIVHGGTNDMVGQSAAATYEHFVALCRYLKSRGSQVLAVPMLSRTGNGFGAATMDSLKNTFNNLIMANWTTFADAVVNPATYPGLFADLAYNNAGLPTACNGGVCFQGDGIHPTSNGGKALADAYVIQINAMGALAFPGSGAPSITGCSITAPLGSNITGQFASGTTGVCTVTLTFTATATNGWFCSADDLTTFASFANIFHQTGGSITTAIVAATTVSGDVVKYSCLPY